MRRLINQHPGRAAGLALGVLPFVALLVLYVVASHLRLAENPDDKLLPALGKIADTFHSYAFEEDRRSGRVLFWADTWASLKRIGSALVISAMLGMMLAVAHRRDAAGCARLLSPLLGTMAMIPPLAILPVLFIVLGLEETAKIALIVIGIAPCIARDLALRVGELPKEQLIKAQTLGASTWLLVLRVVLPQLWPRLIDSVRLSMGSAWLFLIAAEAIASTEGLGYRIFLVRRYLAMDVILPYVVWITLLAVATDLALRMLRARAFAGPSRSADGHRHRPQCVEGVRRAGRAGERAPGDRRPRVRHHRRRFGMRQDDVPQDVAGHGAADARARSSSTASRSGRSRIRIAASCSSATRRFRT